MEVLLKIPITLLSFLIVCSSEGDINLSRSKRFLLFPSGSNVIQLIIGVGIPVEVSPESVIIGWAVRSVYALPTNLSELQYSDYGESRRNKRHVSRWDIYKLLQQEATSRGYEGRACVLKSICEAADIPLDRNHGLFEELFHSVFTPTSTNEEIDHHTDNDYFAAQMIGKNNRGKCNIFFPECEMSLLDMFTHTFSNDAEYT